MTDYPKYEDTPLHHAIQAARKAIQSHAEGAPKSSKTKQCLNDVNTILQEIEWAMSPFSKGRTPGLLSFNIRLVKPQTFKILDKFIRQFEVALNYSTYSDNESFKRTVRSLRQFYDAANIYLGTNTNVNQPPEALSQHQTCLSSLKPEWIHHILFNSETYLSLDTIQALFQKIHQTIQNHRERYDTLEHLTPHVRSEAAAKLARDEAARPKTIYLYRLLFPTLFPDPEAAQEAEAVPAVVEVEEDKETRLTREKQETEQALKTLENTKNGISHHLNQFFNTDETLAKTLTALREIRCIHQESESKRQPFKKLLQLPPIQSPTVQHQDKEPIDHLINLLKLDPETVVLLKKDYEAQNKFFSRKPSDSEIEQLSTAMDQAIQNFDKDVCNYFHYPTYKKNLKSKLASINQQLEALHSQPAREEAFNRENLLQSIRNAGYHDYAETFSQVYTNLSAFKDGACEKQKPVATTLTKQLESMLDTYLQSHLKEGRVILPEPAAQKQFKTDFTKTAHSKNQALSSLQNKCLYFLFNAAILVSALTVIGLAARVAYMKWTHQQSFFVPLAAPERLEASARQAEQLTSTSPAA